MTAVFDVLEKELGLVTHLGLTHHEITAHVDDLRDVLDKDRAFFHARTASAAAPKFFFEHRRRPVFAVAEEHSQNPVRDFFAGLLCFEEGRAHGIEMGLHVLDEFARAQRDTTVARGANAFAAAAVHA